jgi:hypothetical protein
MKALIKQPYEVWHGNEFFSCLSLFATKLIKNNQNKTLNS